MSTNQNNNRIASESPTKCLKFWLVTFKFNSFILFCKWIKQTMVHPLECFFGIKCHAALDRNPGQRYNTQILQLTPGDLYSESPNRHFQTLPGRPFTQSVCTAKLLP